MIYIFIGTSFLTKNQESYYSAPPLRVPRNVLVCGGLYSFYAPLSEGMHSKRPYTLYIFPKAGLLHFNISNSFNKMKPLVLRDDDKENALPHR